MTTPPLDPDDVVLGMIRDAIADDGVVYQLATGGVWQSTPAQDAEPPLVIVSAADASDLDTYADTAWSTMLVEVRAIAPHRGGGVPAVVSRLAAAIRTLLTDGDLSTTGICVGAITRIGRVAVDDTVDGVTYHHRGGVYRVTYTRTA